VTAGLPARLNSRPPSFPALLPQVFSQAPLAEHLGDIPGSLQPRQRLPSGGQLSAELAINPNSVARAFQILQSEGIVELLRGRGLAVCVDAVEKCRDARRSLITARLRAALAEALHGGLTAQEIRYLLDGNVRTIASRASAKETLS